jgi:hypothetical protein
VKQANLGRDLFCFGMEQQDNCASTPPCTQQPSSHHHSLFPSQDHRRDTAEITGDKEIPSESRGSSTTRHNKETLSTSEPSLRFPRPVGNSHLANWISTSDPDIMRILSEATDDAGLAESTYELITGADDSDNWSQDGNDNECISESVSSLDPRRPDDIHSLADTEQNTDDDDFTSVNVERPSQTPRALGIVPKDHMVPVKADDDDKEDGSGDGRASSPSLDYTQQSLGTPSMSTTPEASKVLPELEDKKNPDGATQARSFMERIHYETLHFRAWVKENRDYLQQGLQEGTISLSHPALLALAGLQILVFLVIGTFVLSSAVFNNTNVPKATLPEVVATTTQAPLLLTSSSSSTSPSKSLASPSTGTALNLRDDSTSNEWFFGSRKPNVTFSSPTEHSFLAHIPADVKSAWVSEDCVTFTAIRDGEAVDTFVSTVREGLMMRVPRRYAHGSVDLILEATCKPSLRKVVKVRFGRGKLEEWADFTRNTARLLMPGPLSTVEDARDAVKNTWKSFTPTFVSGTSSVLSCAGLQAGLEAIKDNVASFTWSRVAKLEARLHSFQVVDVLHEYRRQATDLVHGTQTNIQLNLLQAQIAAKLSWLSLIGKTEAHDDYKHKAAKFFAEKQARAEARQAQKVKSANNQRTSWWKSLVTPNCPNVRWLNDKVAICE